MAQIATLVKIQCLVAMAEKELNEEEIMANVHKSSYISLQYALNMQGISVQYVVNKVMEDVQKVKETKGKAKIKMAQYREKHINVTSNVTDPVTSLDKIREDKNEIRLDDSGNKGTFLNSSIPGKKQYPFPTLTWADV